MTTIYNNFSFPVVEADSFNFDVSWLHHIQRGSAGGVDLSYPRGSAVLANAAGVVTNVPWYGTGGNTARLTLADGRYIEYMHLSSFSVSTGTSVAAGLQIGLSGASGNGNPNYYAPHLHVHMYVGGVRVNLFYYMDTTPSDSEEKDLYIRRSATGEIAVFGSDYRNSSGGTAGRHVFANKGQYDTWRSILVAYNNEIDAKGTDARCKKAVPPAALGNIMGVDEANWTTICTMYGV